MLYDTAARWHGRSAGNVLPQGVISVFPFGIGAFSAADPGSVLDLGEYGAQFPAPTVNWAWLVGIAD